MMEPIEAVIFDKDGTLFEFEAPWMTYCDGMIERIAGGDRALRNKLAEYCGYDPEKRSFAPDSIIIGGSLSEICSRLASLSGRFSKEQVAQMSADIIAELHAEPVCDLVQLTTQLNDAGLRLGVVTNDLESAASAQLREQNIEAAFSFICGCDSGYAPKPEPDALLGFSRAVGIPPERIAMVGDSLHDLHAARAMGAGLAIGVLTGPANKLKLAPHADHVIDNIASLPELLAKRNGSHP